MAREHDKLYTAAAVAILSAGVLAEGVRLVEPWPGFNPGASRVVSVFLMTLWATAALAVVVRTRRQSLAKGAWAIAVAAPAAMFVHAAVTRVGGSWSGLLYMVAAVLLGFVLKRSFLGSHSPLVTGSRLNDAVRGA